MRGSFGLVVGMAIGAGAMYLVLRPPWQHSALTASSDAPPVVVVDAGVAKPVKKRHSGHAAGHTGAQAGTAGDPEPEEVAPVVLTAADRALDWRGDDVALPPQTIDMAGGGESRSLDDGEIHDAIASQFGGVRDCVAQAATNTDLRVTITVKMLVDGHGNVTKSRVQAPRYLLDHGLLNCVQRASGRIRFPAVGGATIVTLPVNLG